MIQDLPAFSPVGPVLQGSISPDQAQPFVDVFCPPSASAGQPTLPVTASQMPGIAIPDYFSTPFTNTLTTMNVGNIAHVPSLSPPQTAAQAPSIAIHGAASSYMGGVTSSLEAALDPAGISVGRGRSNTAMGSPPTIVFPALTSLADPPVKQETVELIDPEIRDHVKGYVSSILCSASTFDSMT